MNMQPPRLALKIAIGAILIAGLYRLYPVVIGMPALSEAFLTEDGYLMLTIARNMAIGNGMSVSDGTIFSNGVQPLTTFIFTLPYVLTGGDKIASLFGIHLLLWVFAVIGLFSVRALARFVLREQDDDAPWSWLVAALWFCGPLLLLHTMNGLETGLYTAMVALSVLAFGRLLQKGDGAGLSDRLWFGVICGIAFLARNDAVFLISSIFLVWMLHELFVARRGVLATAAALVPPGLVSLAVGAPWMIHNYLGFGSIVPVSGTAQSLSGGFARNADLLPAVLFEHMFPMLPVPHALQSNPIFMVAAVALVVVVLAVFTLRCCQRGGAQAYAVLAYLLFALLHVLYYGFHFGAGWFLSRYLAPLAPLLIIAAFSVLLDLARAVAGAQRGALSVAGLGSLALALCLALLGWLAVPGNHDQGHSQVVAWAKQNLPEDVWVGAVQTGTLGYWHDRTINLDGKVNPEALAAILTEGGVLDYVQRSKIDYLADWAGIAKWAQPGFPGNEAFAEAFDVVVADEEANLAVLKRR